MIETEEGVVSGPNLKFLGSVASREALEDNPQSIVEGRIIGRYRLVVQDLKTPRPTVVSGIVHSEEVPSYRKYRRRSAD
jgi:hypothetical protein